MLRRQGLEATTGIGGDGIVSAESQKNLDIAEDYLRQKNLEESQKYILKALEDPNNIDAITRAAAFLDPKTALVLLKRAESRGRKILKGLLGDKCFDDDGGSVGKFWRLIQTRPYMRVLQNLYQLHLEEGDYEDAVNVMMEMLRLCPADNQGTRFFLGSALIHCGRYADALYFAQQWLGEGTWDDISPSDGAVKFRAPHRNTMTVKKEGNRRTSDGSLLYTAALASFKHFGDCEQSRQYLKMAATAQPIVLVKILARITKPDLLMDGVMSFNGPEQAHNYLVYAYDLWVKPDAWNWANGNPDVMSAILKKCSRPECQTREVKPAEYKRCSACHLVSYCSVRCQEDDWRRHKSACRQHKKDKTSDRAFMQGKPPGPSGPGFNVYDFVHPT